MRRTGLWVTAAACAAACHSPGQYGHARVYAPLSEEQDATAGAKEYDPVMVQRKPEDFKGKTLTFFGVVLSRSEGRGGTARLRLSVRSLEPRNLCESKDEDSCRVTVGDREHAVAHALVKLSADDDIGKLSVGPGSLVRVVGELVDEVDNNDGGAVLKATYYRHWPRNYYVTTADRPLMRR
ncbi:MAG: hypothetical protein R3B13_07305 [Polyangiaceae bacterium]